jgi:7-cyano-7-deazaguanine synthase
MTVELENRKAVVLLSGGLDSTTTLAIAKTEGYRINALTFRYGQRHEVEIEAAHRIASHFVVDQHIVVQIDLRVFGGSALTSEIAVPKDRAMEEMGQGIPVTYVPARNTIFLSFALAWAEVLEANDIFIGVNAIDYKRLIKRWKARTFAYWISPSLSKVIASGHASRS